MHDKWYVRLGVDRASMYDKVGMDRYHLIYADMSPIMRLIYLILGF
jgi:hypothetical protein